MSDWTRYKIRPVYLTDGWEYVRTEPSPENEIFPYRTFVRTTLGEAETLMLNGKISKVVFDCQLHGKEITEDEYRVAIPDVHRAWRQKILQ